MLKSLLIKLMSQSESDSKYFGDEPDRVYGGATKSDHDGKMNFSITPAVGGRIIEVGKFKKDQGYQSKLYLITSDECLSEKLEKILTMESIR